MNNKIFTLLICLTLASCGGLRSFHEYARAGDTVAVPIGFQPEFSKDNVVVTITPPAGSGVAPIVLSAANNDPEIRGIINFYPDPISNMIISREIGEDTSEFAQTYAQQVYDTASKYKDYYQTTVFLDLPTTLPVGLTTLDVSNGTDTHSMTLDIIADSTGGDPTTFANQFLADVDGASQPLSPEMFDSMARAPHNEITFDFAPSKILPHAIEMDFTHDPDAGAGGAGETFVVNPVGYLMNSHWSDDGTNLKVILIESQPGIITRKKDFKFYVAGTTTNLVLNSITGYDINGNTLVDAAAVITTR